MFNPFYSEDLYDRNGIIKLSFKNRIYKKRKNKKREDGEKKRCGRICAC